MTVESLLAKWSDLLAQHGREMRINGALRIDEPEKIMRDLRLAGYEASGNPTVLSNGSRLYRRWRATSQMSPVEELRRSGMVPANIDDAKL